MAKVKVSANVPCRLALRCRSGTGNRELEVRAPLPRRFFDFEACIKLSQI